MTVKEALSHDWKEGEKLWEVYYKYNREITEKNWMFMTKQPVGVIEVTVKNVERKKAEGVYESVGVSLTADWGMDEEDVCYGNSCLHAIVNYLSWGEQYSHQEFCVDKFFNKKDAEKRLKVAVNSWNKKVKRFQDNQKAKIKKAKREYEKLCASGVIDANEHMIKTD